MHFRRYIDTADASIESKIHAIATDRSAWDENHISYSICEGLREQLGVTRIEGLGTPVSIGWKAFKHKGKNEKFHGDIAVLVRYAKNSDPEPLSGVGFLEAKVALLQRPRYESIEWEQLQRICAHTRYSMLLLYNHRRIGSYGDNVAFQKYSADGDGGTYSAMSSYACALQTRTALQLGRKDEAMHAHAVPLSHQLCNRYLRFMDLDTDPKTLDGVLGWLKEYASPTFLLIATVTLDKTAVTPANVNVNEDIYKEIGKDAPRGRSGGADGGGAPNAPKPEPKPGGEARELPGEQTADAVTKPQEAQEAEEAPKVLEHEIVKAR